MPVSGQLRKVACGDPTSRRDASAEWLLLVPPLVRTWTGREPFCKCAGWSDCTSKEIILRELLEKEEEITASSFNRRKLPVNKRGFWQVSNCTCIKERRKGHFCEDGRAWHPVCHHSDDGNYSKQSWTSPFPRQVSGTSGIFVVADCHRCFALLLANNIIC